FCRYQDQFLLSGSGGLQNQIWLRTKTILLRPKWMLIRFKTAIFGKKTISARTNLTIETRMNI
ncbi:MAG TPA: hypothetical protein VHO90_05580, partial [Bacteroidales bacterium]|nr:hypothetical protein [Bacteroidales bacterium]